MHCNFLGVLDESIPSSYLHSDGVGSFCKECERDAAVQGDEGLQEREQQDSFRLPWSTRFPSLPVNLRMSCIFREWQLSGVLRLKKKKKKTNNFICFPQTLVIFPETRKGINQFKILKIWTWTLSDTRVVISPLFFLLGRIKSALSASIWWLLDQGITSCHYPASLVFYTMLLWAAGTFQRSDLLLTSVSPDLSTVSFL